MSRWSYHAPAALVYLTALLCLNLFACWEMKSQPAQARMNLTTISGASFAVPNALKMVLVEFLLQ